MALKFSFGRHSDIIFILVYAFFPGLLQYPSQPTRNFTNFLLQNQQEHFTNLLYNQPCREQLLSHKEELSFFTENVIQKTQIPIEPSMIDQWICKGSNGFLSLRNTYLKLVGVRGEERVSLFEIAASESEKMRVKNYVTMSAKN